MKRLTSKKLNAVQCKHRWKGLVLTPEAHINLKKAQTEVKTDRLDLVIRNSNLDDLQKGTRKTDRRTLGDGGDTLQYITEHHWIGFCFFAFWGRLLNPKQRRMVERAYRAKTRTCFWTWMLGLGCLDLPLQHRTLDLSLQHGTYCFEAAHWAQLHS